MMSFGVMSDDTSTPFSFAMRARFGRCKHRRAAIIRRGNDLQRFRRERRVHATRPGGRGHARLEFSEKLVHCATRYRVPTR